VTHREQYGTMGCMDADQVAALRTLLEDTEWVDRTRDFARTLRTSTPEPGGLLLVGTPEQEPWHLAAHLDDEARWSDIPQISPVLVRWQVPAGAPAHLAVSLDRLEAARRGETVFVVAPDAAPEALLERVSDARRIGATVLAIDGGDPELEGLAHDAIVVPNTGLILPDRSGAEISIDTVQHLVSAAAGEPADLRANGFRDRLRRFLDSVSGTPARSRW
jgi:hypothetical protein